MPVRPDSPLPSLPPRNAVAVSAELGVEHASATGGADTAALTNDGRVDGGGEEDRFIVSCLLSRLLSFALSPLIVATKNVLFYSHLCYFFLHCHFFAVGCGRR